MLEHVLLQHSFNFNMQQYKDWVFNACECYKKKKKENVVLNRVLLALSFFFFKSDRWM